MITKISPCLPPARWPFAQLADCETITQQEPPNARQKLSRLPTGLAGFLAREVDFGIIVRGKPVIKAVGQMHRVVLFDLARLDQLQAKHASDGWLGFRR